MMTPDGSLTNTSPTPPCAPNKFGRLWQSCLRILALFSLLLGLITVCGYFGESNRYFDNCAHFRPQLFAIMLILWPFLLGLKKMRLLFLVLGMCGLIANGLALAPWYLHGKDISPVPSQLRVYDANVYTANTHYEKVLAEIHREKPDLILLEEINAAWLDALAPLRKSYPYVLACPREDNFGIVLFSKLPFVNSRVEYFGKAQLPSLVATVPVQSENVLVIGTHSLPPSTQENFVERNEQLAKIADFINTQSRPVLLLGDLNMTPWSADYKKLIVATGLRNARMGYGLQASWPTHLPLLPRRLMPPFRIPIDHALYSKHFVVADYRRGRDIGSDHLPLLVDFGLREKFSAEVAFDQKFSLPPSKSLEW